MVLKPNMVVPGKKCAKRASVEEVAEKTVRLLKACVPAAVPGIAFLSGGQSDEEATAHLDAMNRIGGLPWKLTFSYGRALQAAPQKAWAGKAENVRQGAARLRAPRAHERAREPRPMEGRAREEGRVTFPVGRFASRGRQPRNRPFHVQTFDAWIAVPAQVKRASCW